METVGAKVPPELAEEIEEYREAHGLNKSQAIRELVEDSLDRQGFDTTISFPVWLVWFGSLLVAGTFFEVTTNGGIAGIVFMAVGFLLGRPKVVQFLSQLHERLHGDRAEPA